MGPQDRSRARARRRRRQLFIVLLEASALTLLIGLFPPLRKMLYGTAILVVVLLTYVIALIRIRAIEVHLARVRLRAGARSVPERYPATNGAPANGHGSIRANGNGNGHGAWHEEMRQGGVRIVDEDVHLVIRTSEEIEREAILAAAAQASRVARAE